MRPELNKAVPLMALTQDGLPISHVEQADRLCRAGVRWIQLRMKHAAPVTWFETARAVVSVCRGYNAVCIINDGVGVALATGADGVHLGRFDLDWTEARRRLGPRCLLGGTVNNEQDAQRARACGVLDYVGVGPLRFTTTKEQLAPVLGIDGVRALVVQLGGLPAWAIGGVNAADLPAVRAVGAVGVAVSGALFRDGGIEENVRAFMTSADAPGPSGDGTFSR